MAGITTYLSILTMNVNGLNSPIKRHCLANWIKKEDLITCCLQETHVIDRNTHWLRVKGWKKIYQANAPPPKTGRSSNTNIRQSIIQTYIGQRRQRRSLHTNKRGNTLKGNNNYQPIMHPMSVHPISSNIH
jgi:exonuclease III